MKASSFAASRGRRRPSSPREQLRLIEIAVETASRRVPIVAATGTNCTRETIALTRAAEAAGATAALIVTPYYNKPNQEGLYRHYSEIAKAVGIPLVLENDPSRTCVEVRPETLAKLSEIPNIVGIEDVNCDLSRFSVHSLSSAPNFIRWSGDNSSSLLFRMAGGSSSVSVVANVVPRLWAEHAPGKLRGGLEPRQVNSDAVEAAGGGASTGNEPSSGQICSLIGASLV